MAATMSREKKIELFRELNKVQIDCGQCGNYIMRGQKNGIRRNLLAIVRRIDKITDSL